MLMCTVANLLLVVELLLFTVGCGRVVELVKREDPEKMSEIGDTERHSIRSSTLFFTSRSMSLRDRLRDTPM